MSYCAGLFSLILLWGAHVSTAQTAVPVPPPNFVSTGTITMYIAAEEVVWDYAPGVVVTPNAYPYVGGGSYNKIGQVYKKAHYVQYTGSDFATPQPIQSGLQHMGILGPIIRARVGNVLTIVFKNKLTFPVSIKPHALFYTSAADDGTTGVAAGATHTYTWYVGEAAGPGNGQFSSRVYAYSSGANPGADFHSGLVGPIVINRQGLSTPSDVDVELFAFVSLFDENQSHYLNANVATYCAGGVADTTNATFIEGNKKYNINGRFFDTFTVPTVTVTQRVRWYAFTLGDHDASFSPVFEGGPMQLMNVTSDTLTLVPGSNYEANFVPILAGTFLARDMTLDHYFKGLYFHYTVTGVTQTPTPSTTTYFWIEAIDTNWTYTGTTFFENEYTIPSAANVGATYIKCVYMGWHGNSTTEAWLSPYWTRGTAYPPFQPADQYHYGVLGSKIWGYAGGQIKVFFRNSCQFPASIHSHAVFHSNAGQNGDTPVMPGAERQYLWQIPLNAGPAGGVSTRMYPYYSTVDIERDIHTGLLGVMTIVAPGIATDTFAAGTPDGFNEFVLMFFTFDETKSYYLDRTIQESHNTLANPNDPNFHRLQKKHSINGYIFDSVPALVAILGKTTRWYVASMGYTGDAHSASFQGIPVQLLSHTTEAGFAVPGSVSIYDMRPQTTGVFKVTCGSQDHVDIGEAASFTVAAELRTDPPIDAKKAKHYYIAAEKVDWDYAPINVPTGQPADTYLVHSATRVGHVYQKFVYRQYTDGSFTKRIDPTPRMAHKGILGPVMRVSVGDSLNVTFANRVSAADYATGFNLVFAGLTANSTFQELYDPVLPGGIKSTLWYVPANAGPSYSDGPTTFSLYSSQITPTADLNAGLVGPLIVSRAGEELDEEGKPFSVNREFIALFHNFDENLSPLIVPNTLTYAPSASYGDAAYQFSNVKHSINGYIFNNIDQLGMTMYNGEQLIRWYVASVGVSSDVHAPTWSSQPVSYSIGADHRDAVSLFPAVTMTVDMNYPQNVGTWELACGVLEYAYAGQTAQFTIAVSSAPVTAAAASLLLLLLVLSLSTLV